MAIACKVQCTVIDHQTPSAGIRSMRCETRCSPFLAWRPNHESLGVHLSLGKAFGPNQRVHLCSCPEPELLIKSQSLRRGFEEGLTALRICTVTAVSDQHATSALPLILWRRADNFEICKLDVNRWDDEKRKSSIRTRTPMTTILHQLPMLRCPHGKSLVAQRCIRLPWPFGQAEIREDARLWFYPFAKSCKLSCPRVDSFEEVRLEVLHLVQKHGFPESSDGGHAWPAGERVRVLEGVEVYLYACRYVFGEKRLYCEGHCCEVDLL